MHISQYFLRGDVRGAIAHMRAHEEFRDVLPAYLAIFENCEYRTYGIPAPLNDILRLYQIYFRDTFYCGLPEAEAADKLLARLKKRLDLPDADEARLTERLQAAFAGVKYKLTFYSDMDEWLKCHLALILPVCYVCYACNGDLTKATAEQRKLMLDAAWEGCRMLKAAGVPVNDAENTSYYEACTPGRKKMDRMMLMMTKTPLGRLCASDHAMHAVEEMHYHDEAFEAIRATTRTAMPAWDTLRNEMPSWKTLLLRSKHRV